VESLLVSDKFLKIILFYNPEKLKDYSVNIRNLSIALSIVYIVFWCMIWLINVLHKNNNKFLQLKEIIRNNS
jgi:hypothetical protein